MHTAQCKSRKTVMLSSNDQWNKHQHTDTVRGGTISGSNGHHMAIGPHQSEVLLTEYNDDVCAVILICQLVPLMLLLHQGAYIRRGSLLHMDPALGP